MPVCVCGGGGGSGDNELFNCSLKKIAYEQISDHLEENKLLCPRQFTVRREKCAQSAVMFLNEHIRQNMDKSRCTGAAYLDVRKVTRSDMLVMC